jgi:hypothetical protein
MSTVLPGGSETQSWHTFFSPFHTVFSRPESFEGVYYNNFSKSESETRNATEPLVAMLCCLLA